MSLYHKYRPGNLESIYGNGDIIKSLQNMLGDVETCPKVFLLHGPTGCGKTTIGRIIAKELECVGNDFREINSADFRGIDSVRDIIKQSRFKSLESPCRIWLIDECHRLTTDAQNAILKLLEDPPKNVYFILCTTDPQKLISTVRGRCSQFAVKALSERQMFQLLREIITAEGEQLSKTIYEQIYQDSFGYPRNALQILEQVLRADPEQRLEIAKQSALQVSESIALCRALLSKNDWKKVLGILNGLKDQEPESIRRHVIGYASAVLLKEENDHAAYILEEFMEPNFTNGFPQLVLSCYTVIKG